MITISIIIISILIKSVVLENRNNIVFDKVINNDNFIDVSIKDNKIRSRTNEFLF